MKKKTNGQTSKLRQRTKLPQFLLAIRRRLQSVKKRYYRQPPARYIVLKWSSAPKPNKRRQLSIPLLSRRLELAVYCKEVKAKPTRQFKLPLGNRLLVISAKAKATRRLRRSQIKTLSFKLAHLTNAILITAGLVGSSYFGLQAYSADRYSGDFSFSAPAPLATVPTHTAPASPPTQLTITKIGVNANLIELGQQADQTIEVPQAYDVAGWYKYSPTPGELGPAVIVGHVDSYQGAAVFYQLKELRPGDTVEVKRADGQLIKFRVTEVKQFDQASFPTDEVYGNLDYPGLRLITCGGTFNRNTLNYSHNTVVFAKAI